MHCIPLQGWQNGQRPDTEDGVDNQNMPGTLAADGRTGEAKLKRPPFRTDVSPFSGVP